MRPLNDRALLAYLAQALDPGREREVREELDASPALRRRLSTLASRMMPPLQAESPWRIPPPGVAGGRHLFAMQASPSAVMGGPIRAGGRFELLLDPTDWADARVVVLHHQTGRWEVVFPNDPLDVLTLAELPETDDGRRILELAAGEGAGLQRWALALLPPHLELDWEASADARWRPLREGLAMGEIPVATVEIGVE